MKILLLMISLLFSAALFSQPRLHPGVGIHISGDAQMYYIGPSFQLGADYYLKKRILLCGYLHSFSKWVDKTYPDNSFEKGRFKTTTVAVLVQFNLSKKPSHSIFIAGGIAAQKWADKFESSWADWNKKRTTLLPALRLGYFFTMSHIKMAIELNGTGPYSYNEEEGGVTWGVTEVLTQLSAGLRFIL